MNYKLHIPRKLAYNVHYMNHKFHIIDMRCQRIMCVLVSEHANRIQSLSMTRPML